MQTFVNSENEAEYIVRVKSKNYWWLLILLLLLLPLLLLLRFNKNVEFHAEDIATKQNLGNVNVDFQYVDHTFIRFSPFGFFVSDTVKLNGATNENGKLLFTDVNYSLFSVVFYSSENAIVTASGGCLSADTLKPVFAKMQDFFATEIPMQKNRTEISFKVVDTDDNQPLPGAEIKAEFGGETVNLKSDPSGYVTIPNVPKCDDLRVIGYMEGFSGDTIASDVETLLLGEYNRTLKLTPGKGIVSFIVQDLETKLNIAGARAKLLIDNKSQEITTNTDGIGKGFFENVSAKNEFHIEVSKLCYHDTLTQTYKLTGYQKLKDDEKIIKMRPEKGNFVFRNIDSASSQPIEGIANQIFINGIDKGTAYSNKQGCFTIGNIGQNDDVKIVASGANYFEKTWIRKGSSINSNQHSRDVAMKMKPIMMTAPLRNCGVHFSGTLLSDVAVNGHISKIYEPDIYGEYVGDGRYISNQAAFPKAVQYTFDAIAVDKGTHLKIFSKPNFQGEVLLDVSGPYLINNCKWKNESRIKNVCEKTFSPELESNYPKSCRHWSETNMNQWDFGSCVITCDK